MKDIMEHKGYYGSASHSDEDAVFHGKIEFIRDLVTFEANDKAALDIAFKEAVEEYLSYENQRQP